VASLGRNLAANYVGRTWTAILGIVLIPIYIRLIGIEAYGLVGFFSTLSSVIGVLDLGIGFTLTRELSRRSANSELIGSQRDLVRTFEIVYWTIAFLAGLIVMILAPFIANTWINAQGLSPESVLRAVQLMGISIVFQFPMFLYQGGLMGLQKQVLVNSILVLTGTIRGGGAILILRLVSPTIQAFFAWQVAMSIVGSIVFLLVMWSNLPLASERPIFRYHIISEVWKYAAAISVNGIIGIVLSQLDKIILSKMLSLRMFAYYSIAGTATAAIWMIIGPFNSAIFPHLVRLHEKSEPEELSRQFHLYSQVLSLCLFPVSAILILFSREILLLWMKDPSIVENTHLIFSLLVFGTMLNGIVSVPACSAPAFGWPLLVTYTNSIQAIVIIPLIIGMVYWLQGVGAAIAWIVLNSTYVLFMVPLFFRRFLAREKRQWYWQDILVPAVVAFSICTVSQLVSPRMNSPITKLGWISVTGMIAFVSTGLTLRSIRSLVSNKWSLLEVV